MSTIRGTSNIVLFHSQSFTVWWSVAVIRYSFIHSFVRILFVRLSLNDNLIHRSVAWTQFCTSFFAWNLQIINVLGVSARPMKQWNTYETVIFSFPGGVVGFLNGRYRRFRYTVFTVHQKVETLVAFNSFRSFMPLLTCAKIRSRWTFLIKENSLLGVSVKYLSFHYGVLRKISDFFLHFSCSQCDSLTHSFRHKYSRYTLTRSDFYYFCCTEYLRTVVLAQLPVVRRIYSSFIQHISAPIEIVLLLKRFAIDDYFMVNFG